MADKLKPAFACDYARMWDLVRYQRAELMEAGLITLEEYAILASEETKNKPGQGSPSPRRLESYDELRKRCVIGEPCENHGFIHGAEAEELRDRLEKAATQEDLTAYEVHNILDDVDARDSLAYVESRLSPAAGRGCDVGSQPVDASAGEHKLSGGVANGQKS